MDANLSVSLKTLLAVSPMLGHKLEDRSQISQRQDLSLLQAWQTASRVPLRGPEQKNLFLVAPLDVLVEGAGAGKRFHIIETNGTGIGGLSNLPCPLVKTIVANLSEFVAAVPGPAALVLVAVSGIESTKHPRPNRLLHEKLLYVDALCRGLQATGRDAQVLTMKELNEDSAPLQNERATVVLGYIKEFLNQLTCEADGRLTLHGRPVAAAINDRFCLNVVSRFGHRVDLTRFQTLNRCFAAGADKGINYRLLNEYSQARPASHFPRQVEFARAEGRAALVANVVDWLRRGRQVVIKPQGTGHGHGLEFFLDTDESLSGIVAKIDHSLRLTEHYYGAVGGAFPYTLCPFIDACTIADPGHALHGHKFELRVVVYRDGMNLMAAPSITKISSQNYDKDKASHLSLINNITTSAEAKNREGTDFMLPLANRETLALLGILPEEMRSLCAYCTGFIRFILDRVQDAPALFGLEQ
jgi:hypothetical protein